MFSGLNLMINSFWQPKAAFAKKIKPKIKPNWFNDNVWIIVGHQEAVALLKK